MLLGILGASLLETNSIHPTNASKIWNCEPNIRQRAETVKDHFKKGKYK